MFSIAYTTDAMFTSELISIFEALGWSYSITQHLNETTFATKNLRELERLEEFFADLQCGFTPEEIINAEY